MQAQSVTNSINRGMSHACDVTTCAIGSSIYKNLKLREEEKKRRNNGLRTGSYSPQRVTCRLRAVLKPGAYCPQPTAHNPVRNGSFRLQPRQLRTVT